MTATPPPPGPAGPPVEALTRRLAETPADLLALPSVAPGGGDRGVRTEAVVSDLLVLLGAAPLTSADATRFRAAAGDPATVAWHRVVLVAAWLLADPWFVAAGLPAAAVLAWFADLRPLAEQVAAPTLVADPDRREELARRALAAFGVRPAGETEAQAADRLATLDSVEQARVLAATAEAERRAAAVREAMHRKAAAEAAAKASRE